MSELPYSARRRGSPNARRRGPAAQGADAGTPLDDAARHPLTLQQRRCKMSRAVRCLAGADAGYTRQLPRDCRTPRARRRQGGGEPWYRGVPPNALACRSMTNVGDMYLNGFGTTTDDAKRCACIKAARGTATTRRPGKLGCCMHARFPQDDGEARAGIARRRTRGAHPCTLHPPIRMGAARETRMPPGGARVLKGGTSARTQLINEAGVEHRFRRVCRASEAGFYDGDIAGGWAAASRRARTGWRSRGLTF